MPEFFEIYKFSNVLKAVDKYNVCKILYYQLNMCN